MVHIVREYAETKSVIIFTNTCRNCQILSQMLRNIDLKCVALHSLMSQNERLASLAKFKTGIANILVATDVASRGLDIPSVELVLNSNVPASPVDYIHRVGRTARAGRGGMAVTLMTQYDIERVHAIEDRINTKLTELEVNENEVVKILKAVSVVRREVEIRLKDSGFGEKRLINKRKRLILDGKSPRSVERNERKKKRK